jgi:hypothetical protein
MNDSRSDDARRMLRRHGIGTIAKVLWPGNGREFEAWVQAMTEAGLFIDDAGDGGLFMRRPGTLSKRRSAGAYWRFSTRTTTRSDRLGVDWVGPPEEPTYPKSTRLQGVRARATSVARASSENQA